LNAQEIATTVSWLERWAMEWPGFTSNDERHQFMEVVSQQSQDWGGQPGLSYSEKAREWYRQRRARKFAAPYEYVPYAEIYERDNWICQLCLESVDMALGHPHPMSRSIDHIIPLAGGGSHVADNLQLAHLGCNMSKHTSSMDEWLRTKSTIEVA